MTKREIIAFNIRQKQSIDYESTEKFVYNSCIGTSIKLCPCINLNAAIIYSLNYLLQHTA